MRGVHPIAMTHKCPADGCEARLGVSVEDQQRADDRIPDLLKTPAAVRFLSCEPLLGPIDLTKLYGECGYYCDEAVGHVDHQREPSDWVIAGCESRGKRVGRLPGDSEEGYWDAARSLRDQCRAAGVAFFQKQGPVRGRVSHDPNDWPEDLRVREFPEVAHA